MVKITCGCLYTADDRGRFYSPAALLLDGNRIAWVGDARECPAPADHRHIDLGDCAVIPGLVNAHGHSGLNRWRGVSDAQDFTQWAAELSPHTASLSDGDIALANADSVAEMLRGGTTCVCDCTRYAAGQLADAATEYGMRCVAGGLANSPEYRPDGRPNFAQIRADTALFQRKHAGNPLARFYIGAHSPYNCTPELLQEAYRASEETGGVFVIHAAETDREVETIRRRYGMGPVQWLDRIGVLAERTVLIHCVKVDRAEIDQIAQRGCAVVHCPVSNAKLGNGIAPVAELIATGVRLGLGTDSMLSNNSLDLFGEMKTAALVHRLRGLEAELTNEQIVRMATIGGARALGLSRDTGSLEPGKYADLAVLGCSHPLGYDKRRLLSDLVFYAGPRDVRQVWVGGRCVYRDGRFPFRESVCSPAGAV